MACTIACRKSTFLTFLTIVFMSSLLFRVCSHASHVCVFRLIIKPDTICVICQVSDWCFAQHNELRFCPGLKKIHTNTTRKKNNIQSMMSFHRLLSYSQPFFWTCGILSIHHFCFLKVTSSGDWDQSDRLFKRWPQAIFEP